MRKNESIKSNRFYLACMRDNVGSNVAFHCVNGMGYSTDIDRAHVYTLEEAQHAWEHGRDFDLPLCAERVGQFIEWHVDCQLLPSESTMDGDDGLGFVAYQKGKWDGNDVYWLRPLGQPSTDFFKAMVWTMPVNVKGFVCIPFSVAKKAKRKTISSSLINRRTMQTAAGIRVPEHVKRSRRRSESGKTRWNCPCCGKINWQHNPYDFEGCRDSTCEGWSA